MANVTGLGGEIVAFTYPALVKVADNDIIPFTTGGGRSQPSVIGNPNRTSTPNALGLLTDGTGQASSLSIGLQNAGAKITGPTIIDGQDTNFTDGKLLEVCNGGVYIENQLYVCDKDVDGNSICGTTDMGVLNVDNTARICGNATICADATICCNLTVGGTSTLSGNTCICNNLTVTGSVDAGNDITAFSTSDKRLKNNIIKIDNSNNIINSLNGYVYEWDKKSGKSGEGVGVLAQEVKELIPSAVRENKEGYLSVDYLKIIPYLIEEVKSLNNRIKTLEEK